MKKLGLVFVLVTILSATLFAQTTPQGAPAGQGAVESDQRFQEYDKRIDAIQTDLDYVWVILSAALVFFMQAGFMALEAGMARSKNSINVAIKNLTDFVIGVVGFWVIGFGLMFGRSKLGLFGTTDFLITLKDPWTAAFFMFQSVFVGTAATIDSGAICERAKLKQYILLSFLMSVLMYPVFGHWAWGSFLHGSDPLSGGAGWLERLGFKDFAGSSVVHSAGGWMALAGIIVVGPRLGKFEKDPVTGRLRSIRQFQPGDMRFVFLGTFVLFFGWFGFNCGSTLSATPDIAGIALNTTIAACFGCIVSSLLSWVTHPQKKIEGGMIANGVLGGLVAITAGCAYVDTTGAAIIGVIAGFVVFYGSHFVEKVLKLDDVVGAVPVHGFCGAWGTFAVGIFITKEHLGDLTRLHQIGVQGLGVAVCFAWSFGLGILLYFLVDRLAGGVRVSEEDEILGLNVAEHGATSSLLDLAQSMDSLTRTGNFEGHQGVAVDYGTEVGDLAQIFNQMIGRIKLALSESKRQQALAERMLEESRKQQNLTEEAKRELEQTRQSSEEHRQGYISQANSMVSSVIQKADEIRSKMENTTQVTAQMYGSFKDLTTTLGSMLESLSRVYEKMREMGLVNSSAAETARKTKLDIHELNGIAKEIDGMIEFINDIAEKTHVLSINTAIEAARSADAKGFSVISKEVRRLSQLTASAAVDIGSKIKGIEDRISHVVASMDTIGAIVDRIEDLNSSMLHAVEENEAYTHSLETKTKDTIDAVETVSHDVDDVVEEVREVTRLGEAVKKGLKDMG